MTFDYGTQPWDSQDKKYLKKLIDKVLKESDGKIPLKQLSDEEVAKFPGVNIQGQAINPPEPEEITIALYMIDADQKLSKRFTVTNAFRFFMARQTRALMYGTTSPDGHQAKTILQWEKEIRVDPKQADKHKQFRKLLPDGQERDRTDSKGF